MRDDAVCFGNGDAVSKEIGCFGVLTHPIGGAEFYMRFGFETLPFDPERSMVVRIVDLERGRFLGVCGELILPPLT